MAESRPKEQSAGTSVDSSLRLEVPLDSEYALTDVGRPAMMTIPVVAALIAVAAGARIVEEMTPEAIDEAIREGKKSYYSVECDVELDPEYALAWGW